MHEHLFLNEEKAYFSLPQDPSRRETALEPLGIGNLGWVRFNMANNADNLRLDDEGMMADEATRFKNAGGRTIVDVTTNGLFRDPSALRRLSTQTGLNIVAGAGYYVASSHGPEMDDKTVDDLKDEIVQEIREGMNGTDVKAGIIGEIGTTYPWGRNEQKVLEAAIEAQLETGAALGIHPGRNPRHPGMILDILENRGAELDRTIIYHMDRTVGEYSDFKSVLDRGCCVSFDLFGQSWYQIKLEFPFPSDAMRVFMMKKLIDAGYAKGLLMSQDIDEKFMLYRYGNYGYAHILENVVPFMRGEGISQEVVDQILVRNPLRLLTFR